jgi:hypothetical protein
MILRGCGGDAIENVDGSFQVIVFVKNTFFFSRKAMIRIDTLDYYQ